MESERLALLLLLGYFAVIWLLRSLLQKRWTGSSGWRGLRGTSGAAAWAASLVPTVGLALLLLAPMAQLQGWTAPAVGLEAPGARVLALTLYGLGLAGTFGSQLAMGRSWRIGIDPDERTELVTRGPFRLVRNPIYTSLLAAVCGIVLLVPNPVASAALALVWIGLELQVRLVEEPHVERLHGERYRAWAARTGRFVPWFGRLGSPAGPSPAEAGRVLQEIDLGATPASALRHLLDELSPARRRELTTCLGERELPGA